jgi:4-hydroxybenzoyl-CoA thioesterase/acyl-CoA thioester hydrolase
MQATHRVTRLVEWADTDAAGIMHFSAYFIFMEQAEHEFLRSRQLSVTMQRDDQTTISWPRVAASCSFQGSACFEDLLDIDVAIERLGRKSVTYAFQFSRAGEPIAAGSMTSVCCVIEAHAPPRSIEIPADFVAKLRPFVTE